MKKVDLTVFIFSFLLFIFLTSRVHAQNIPTLTPYVNDFANVIDASYEAQINNYAAQLEAATTAEIAVMTVDSTQPMSIEQYAVEVFEKNGIGQKGEDNGILIVAAIGDRQWRIEVGYGLEGDINDAKAGRIGRTYMTPYFREEKYGEGLYLTVQTLGEIIGGNATVSAQFDQPSTSAYIPIIVFVVIGILVFVVFVSLIYARKKLRCPKCGAWMRIEHKRDKICYVCKKCKYKKCEKRKRRAHVFVFVGAGGRGGGGWSGGGGGFGGGGSGGAGAGGSW